jgi:hypothetical protein
MRQKKTTDLMMHADKNNLFLFHLQTSACCVIPGITGKWPLPSSAPRARACSSAPRPRLHASPPPALNRSVVGARMN